MDAATLGMLLVELPGIGRRRILEFVRLSGGHWPEVGQPSELKDLLAQHQKQLRLNTLPSQQVISSAFERVQVVIEASWKLGLSTVAYGEKNYPVRLTKIPDPAAVLFCRGSLECLSAPIIGAVIGTRQPTKFGKWTALRLAQTLGRHDIVVVSGLAVGCDTFAHRGCLEAKGLTVAVLAHGLHKVHPAQNRQLAEAIVETGGCLISEYPPGTPAFRNQFVDRDRLQIGLSDFLILVESDVQGGSMHTVKFCRVQRKPVGCIAHPERYLFEPKTRGNQSLIRSGDALAISDLESLAHFIAKATSIGTEKAKAIKTEDSNQVLFPEHLGEVRVE